jgi:RimJ/RimL family protein N-acetyltransferase
MERERRRRYNSPVLDRRSWRVTIETERLRLVPQTPADADEMASVLADPALYAFTGGEPPTADALRARYERQAAGASPGGTEVWANWIVRRGEDGAAVGYVQATIDAAGADLAWVVGTAWQDRGYAGEAAGALAAFLRGAGVAPLTAHIRPRHEAAERVAARLGLRRSGEVDADGEVVWSDGSRVR